jgi:hypothetical protein
MSIQDAYSYGASSDSYLIGGHSYQCVCVLHAILLPSGYLTLSTIASYNYPKIIRSLQEDSPG